MGRDKAPSHGLAEFLQALGGLGDVDPALSGVFDTQRPLTLARAPGRLDVMGGFADYSGSLTLEMPIREAAFVAVQSTEQPTVNLVSLDLAVEQARARSIQLPLSEVRRHACRYHSARDYFAGDASSSWGAYVGGVLAALGEDVGFVPQHGLNLVLGSTVPEGKGVSSSAAIEVATLAALCAHFRLGVDAHRMALLCQRVENLVVGAPCGVMDQMTSSCGVEGEFLPLLCQPAQLAPSVALPDGLSVWGIDSGIRHQVSGADYGQVRTAAFMGYRIIAGLCGFDLRSGGPGQPSAVHDDRYGGYLANVSPAALESDYREHLPEQMTGEEFLDRYEGITDTVTRVRRAGTYRVLAATSHPVHEHQRVTEFCRLLTTPQSEEGRQRLGQLMLEAHASYSACGLGSTGTDRLVELAMQLGPEHGLYGAKITGGGSGGTVAVVGRASAAAGIERVVAQYAAETGHHPHLFVGSSPGAAAYGTRQARWAHDRWQVLG